MIDLTGKTALVTGGSRGIGRAICLLLATAGANIVVVYRRDHKAADEVVSEIKTKGRHAVARLADASDFASMESLVSESREFFGKIDIAVLNAGIWQEAPIDEMTEDQWQETIDTNLKSAFITCRLIVPEMKQRHSGNIILISSTAGQRGEAYYSHYAASKGGLIALTKALAAELGPQNIRVNCVAPGWVETDMSRQVLADLKQHESIRQQIPLRRIAKPQDIAGVVLFLASDLSRHVHGEVVNVNGGSVLCG